MTVRTTVIPISRINVRRASYRKWRREYIGSFWEDVTGATVESALYMRMREQRQELVRKVRVARVLVNHFFIGVERDVMFLLLNSVSPTTEIANLTAVSTVATYKRIHYLRRVMTELFRYFEKGTYRKAYKVLKQGLSRETFDVLQVLVRVREIKMTGKILAISKWSIEKHVRTIERFLKEKAYKYESIKDVYVTWCRVRRICKTHYGSHKRALKKRDLDE
jgi:hypothetical protein